MKIAICISGQPRFANFGSYHQKKFANLLPSDWQVDFYVQTWSQEGVEQHQDMLFGHCDPKRVRIDTQYKPTQFPNFFHKIRGLSQHYAHYLCQQQIRNIDDYDLIIRSRHDVMFNTEHMEYQIENLEYVNRHKSVSGYGFYPDYADHPSVTTNVSSPSHRGFSPHPTFDDWAIVAHRDHWKNYCKTENEFNKILDDMFLDPINEHSTATYELEGKQKKVCIPERVWYNLTNLNHELPFTTARGFAYLARPSLKGILDKDFRDYKPSEVRDAMRKGWQNGAAVLQYSICL